MGRKTWSCVGCIHKKGKCHLPVASGLPHAELLRQQVEASRENGDLLRELLGVVMEQTTLIRELLEETKEIRVESRKSGKLTRSYIQDGVDSVTKSVIDIGDRLMLNGNAST
ncbi:hypothetical protein NP233_g10893 [Leucocoprinus birnbaumii]|uniref:Uncharacterized protein n=1 Tax=Leucocoprinus birnbaumii TaxID=56174 RepID=A0AAD5VNG1_9AGAR|nr:hypothetical protein NP233_g10893 [Leucocoprinus birnbaumii]